MRKRMKRLAALAAGCAILFSAAGASDYEAWLADGTVPSLKERYAGILEIGIEYPMPSTPLLEAFAELMPMTSPFIFSRAPPELPGLIAASVWIRFS